MRRLAARPRENVANGGLESVDVVGVAERRAAPAASGSDAAFEHTTGVPQAMASITGRPKPSMRDGKKRQAAA